MHSSDQPVLILGTPGNVFLSLGCKTQETIKGKQNCGVGTSHLPSNNHASFVRVRLSGPLWEGSPPVLFCRWRRRPARNSHLPAIGSSAWPKSRPASCVWLLARWLMLIVGCVIVCRFGVTVSLPRFPGATKGWTLRCVDLDRWALLLFQLEHCFPPVGAFSVFPGTANKGFLCCKLLQCLHLGPHQTTFPDRTSQPRMDPADTRPLMDLAGTRHDLVIMSSCLRRWLIPGFTHEYGATGCASPGGGSALIGAEYSAWEISFERGTLDTPEIAGLLLKPASEALLLQRRFREEPCNLWFQGGGVLQTLALRGVPPIRASEGAQPSPTSRGASPLPTSAPRGAPPSSTSALGDGHCPAIGSSAWY